MQQGFRIAVDGGEPVGVAGIIKSRGERSRGVALRNFSAETVITKFFALNIAFGENYFTLRVVTVISYKCALFFLSRRFSIVLTVTTFSRRLLTSYE